MSNFDTAERNHIAAEERAYQRQCDEQDAKDEANKQGVWDKTQPYGTCYPWSFSNQVEALSEMTPEQAKHIEDAYKTDRDEAGRLLVSVVTDYWNKIAEWELM